MENALKKKCMVLSEEDDGNASTIVVESAVVGAVEPKSCENNGKPVIVEEEQSLCHEPEEIFPVSKVPIPVATQQKIREIETALLEQPANKSKLKELAKTEGGLISDKLRKQAWPVLLDIDTRLATPAPSQEELEVHEEYKQVVMDVNRSLKRFPPNIQSEEIANLQEQLTRLIMRVIIKHPQLRYYQGYHDVAVTFLLVVGEDVAFQIMEKLSTQHFKDYMEPTMDETSYLLNFVYPLIQRMNPGLFDFMERAEVGTIFCLEWPLTWYGHSLKQYRDIVRLYDYFLVSPPLFPLYLAAAMVVHRKDEIFAEECDMASIHNLLSKIPDGLPFESLLKLANSIYNEYPPPSIEREVKERFDEELKRRRYIPSRPQRMPARYIPHWRRWNRYFPPWVAGPLMGGAQRGGYRVLLFTATMVGLYAWLRMAEASDISEDIR